MEFTVFTPLLWLSVLIPLAVAWWKSLVDRPAFLKTASFFLRIIGIVLLILALCRPFWKEETTERHLIFLVDVSESVDLASARKSLQEIKRLTDELGSGDSWSLYAMGAGIRPFKEIDELDGLLESWIKGIADDQFRSATSMADAMMQARIAFPSGKNREMVIFTDGQATDRSSLREAIEALAREEVTVSTGEIEGLKKPEAAVVSISPSTPIAFENEVVRLQVGVVANQKMSAKLRILHKGVAVREQNVDLLPEEENRISFDVTMVSPGPGQWTAELIPAEDFFPVNNQLDTTITVRGKPRVLILHQKTQEMRPFARLLQEQEFDLDVRGGRGLPESLEEMLAFDAILLADLPATDLSVRQMELLRSYVSDFGGGLGMLGSENSFGLGGYFKTPVEEVLPLTSRFEKEKEKPSLSMVLVIDKSGSMQGTPIALARQAAKAAVELLSGRDQIAVIGFDSNPQVIVEMRSASDRASVQAAIDTLAAGGGTDVYPSMDRGREMLESTASKLKHMIILSDGQTAGADHLGLAQSMADTGITVSTVALGSGADRELMSGIAEVGRGRYYETMDPNSVPQIFTKETMQASKSAIKEDLFGLVQTGSHPMLSGYEEADLPFALGYVMTEAKPTAQVLLVAETGDPMLAVSRFGLGMGLSYASDLSEKWGGEWLAWADGGKFWAQALRSLVRKSDVEGLSSTSRVSGDEWVVDIARKDPDGSPVSGVNWDAAALLENGQSATYPVEETGLGKYRVTIPIPEREKKLSLRLHDRDNDKLKVLHRTGEYPAEYRLGGRLPEEFAALPKIGVDSDRDAKLTTHHHRSIVHWFGFAGMACIFAGMVLRRI